MNVPASIFRNYDIRGVVETELTPLIAEHIGKAAGTFFQSRFGTHIVVGHDDRKSSVELKDKLVYGLISCGCTVTDIGLSLTPIVQFLTCGKKFDAGVIVTASHNPQEFNGFRFVGKKAEPIFGDAILELKETIETENYYKGSGFVNYDDLLPDYENFFYDNFKFTKPLKVVVNCGNGTSAILGEKLFSKLGLNVSPLFCEIDSNFPNGIPDPENPNFMKQLSAKVLETKADVGIAFDTDADRLGVVDEKGNHYQNDKLLLLFSKFVLKENPGAKVAFDVKSTYLLEDFVRKFGGEPVLMRTGHPYFVKMVSSGEALLGAEFSGHTYFKDKYLGFDDGVYAASRLLEILDTTGEKLSVLMEEFPKTYHTSEIKVECREEEKDEVVTKVLEASKAEKCIERIETVDGVRAYFSKDCWFLVRKSNTTPHITFRVEASTEEGLNTILDHAKIMLPQLKSLPVDIYFS